MDKRSLIFMITMVASFFLINQWYSSKNQEKLLQMQKESSFVEIESPKAPKMTFNLEDVPLERYADLEDPSTALGFAWSDRDVLITLVKKDAEQKIVLLGQPKEAVYSLVLQTGDGIALYRKNEVGLLNTAFLPQFKEIPVVLVPFSLANHSVVFGSYENQNVSLNEPIGADSIVLVKSGQHYLPIGIYFAEKNRFVLLTDLDPMRQYLTFSSIDIQDYSGKEKFYVLENDFQQIVFSNFGGAIAEINLPFKNEENSSVVYPVQFDRMIEKKFPYEASFPSVPAKTVGDKNQLVIQKGQIGGYYPLLRRDLVGKGEEKGYDIQSRFYALNLIYNGKSWIKEPYQLKKIEKDLIEFEAVEGNKKVVKTFRLPKDNKAPYALLMTLKAEGDLNGVYLSTGIPEVELVGGNFIPLLQYAEKKNNQFVVEKVKLPKATVVSTDEKVSFVANTNGYFGLMLASPMQSLSGYATGFVPGNLAPTRLSVIDSTYDRFPVSKYPGYEMFIPLNSKEKIQEFAFFAGPIEKSILNQADAGIASVYRDPGFSSAETYYGFFSFISEPFAKFLFLVMKIFYSVTHSWGISIILLTVVLRVILYPLNDWATKSMAKTQELQPHLIALQEKYKKDPQRYQPEILKFYRENKINPFSGFLPILVQIPFMIGMFDLLKSAFQLRGATFIPGWINNLSAPDILFSWAYPLPYLGNSFHLLPILVGLAMYWQQKISLAGKIDPKNLTEQQKQSQTIGKVFVFLFPVMFYHMASGLNLYWLCSTLLAIAQQEWTKKRQMNKKTG